jgi:hypothetical protein
VLEKTSKNSSGYTKYGVTAVLKKENFEKFEKPAVTS